MNLVPENRSSTTNSNLKAGELAALADVSRLLAKRFLREITLPQFPPDYVDLLSTTFADVSGDIEAQVKSHVLTHTAGRGESWLSQGLEFSRSDSCPFCGQSLDGVSLFAAFRAYFSDAYSTHTARLRSKPGKINVPSFGQSVLLSCQGVLLEYRIRLSGVGSVSCTSRTRTGFSRRLIRDRSYADRFINAFK